MQQNLGVLSRPRQAVANVAKQAVKFGSSHFGHYEVNEGERALHWWWWWW